MKFENQETGSAYNTTYNAPVKTKSKKLAAILMLLGLGDLYLCLWKKWFIKQFVVLVLTLSIGTLIWAIMDASRIMDGKINCDAHGVPLV